MSQCIRRLFSNTFRSCSNRRGVHTNRAPAVVTAEQLEEKKKSLQAKYAPKVRSPLKASTGFLPTFPPPLKPFLRDEDEKALEELYEMFGFLLRNGAAREYGLPTRPDGYLSVSKLLNYPMFRTMDIFKLQEVVNRGKKYHLHIKFDPRRQDGPWWIRCQLFKEEHFVLEPALLTNANGLGVYQTSLQNWESYISRTGIARFDDDYIRLDPIVQNKNFIDNYEDESQVFIFLDIHLCILHGLRFFSQVHTSQRRSPTSPFLTRGDNLGIIHPSLFSRVQLVEAKKTHVWGIEPSLAQKIWSVEPDDFDQYGQRKTLLPLPPKRLHGFVDLYDSTFIEKRPVHPDTTREAIETVNSAV